MLMGLFDGDEGATYNIAAGRLAYVDIASGNAMVNRHALKAGDTVLYKHGPEVPVAQGDPAEVLVFELPKMDF